MTEPGILLYDLAGSLCPECGRPEITRLHGLLVGCPACDEVITRHRCVYLPDPARLTSGSRWRCQDCGSVWVLALTSSRP